MQVLKKPTIIKTVRLNRLRWFGHVQRMEENRIPRRVLYMNLGTIRLRGDRGGIVVKVLCYKSEGRWFDPSWCQWIFH